MTNQEPAGGYQLCVLTAIMARYSPTSAARRDFLAAREERLSDVPPEQWDDFRVPDEVWDYWSAVAAGKITRYRENGERANGR